jgi:hypothetical protein
MRALLLLASLAAAQTTSTAPASAPLAQFLPARKEPVWLKAYPVTPFRQFWTGNLEVKSLDKSVKAVVDAGEKAGASLTQPLDAYISSGKSKQLALSIPEKNAAEFLKTLRKLGTLPDPQVQQGLPRPNLEELRGKIDRLIKERVEKKPALAQVPATAEASEEILEQLLNAEALAKRTPDAVLLNLTVRETP